MRALLLVSFLFTGCATSAKYQAMLGRWVGKSEERLVAKWGIPDGSYEMQDKTKALIYKEGHASSLTIQGNTTTSNYSCKTTFFIKDGAVKDFDFEGNDCIYN